jgi:uncharacterized membrane-anchored protein YhcB (DUF1043 family)
MPNNPNAPAVGALKIDVSALAPFLVDLAPGETVGMRTEQEGFAEVVQEITSNQTEYGDAAGITQTDFKTLLLLEEQFAQIVEQLPAAMKLVEILNESKAAIDDKRQRLISAFAQSAESRAKAKGNDTTLLAKYEKTRAYRSAIADKGAKTRKKNEAAASAKKTEEEAKAAASAPAKPST